MDPPTGRTQKDFCMPLSDLGEPDKEFARCRKAIESAYGCGGGDPGLSKWIAQEAAGGPRKLYFRVLGCLFYIGFKPTNYLLDKYEAGHGVGEYDSEDDEPQDDRPEEEEAEDDEPQDNEAGDEAEDDEPYASEPEDDESEEDYEWYDSEPEEVFIPYVFEAEEDLEPSASDLEQDLLGSMWILSEKHEYSEAAEVHFTGKMLDGTVFASSRGSDTPLTFKLIQEDVMPGFTLAIASMQPGEKAIFTIPPEFAVTMSGCGASIPWNTPPNQTLRFDIELISLVTDILDDQGILKKTVKFGRGDEHPCNLDEVFVNYNACLKDGTSVSKSEGTEFSLAEGFFCPAFAHALRTMTEGEEVVLVVKPEYGFGERGRPSIGNEAAVPPDATLYINLQLISWKTVTRIGENKDILKKIPFEAKKLHADYYVRNHAVVKVRLIGKLQDGTVFDRRGQDGEEPFEFTMDEEHVIYGLEEAVMTMEKEGEIASFTIPPQYAFGSVGSNQYQLAAVPPNSTVIYEIELVSVVNEEYPRDMSRDETIECARKKEKEGDHLFTAGKYRQAYRRYFIASQILRVRIPRLDGEIKEMLISLAFRGAECAIQIQRYKQASDCYREVLKHDRTNAEALRMAAQPIPRASFRINACAMHRGSISWECRLQESSSAKLAPSVRALKEGHKHSGRMIFVPPVATPEVDNASQPASAALVEAAGQRTAIPATLAVGSNSSSSANTARGNPSSDTARKTKTGLGSFFGSSTSSANN